MAASMTIRLPDELNDRVKARAVKNGVSVSAWVIEHLIAGLDGDDDFDRSNWAAKGNPTMATEVVTRFKRSAGKEKK